MLVKQFILFLLLVNAISLSAQKWHSHDFTSSYHHNLSYELSKSKKNLNKMVLLLQDFEDSLSLKQLSLCKQLHKYHYQILIVAKPGENLFQQQAFDSKQNRVNDILDVLEHLKNKWSTELVIIGFGEGAYLVPELATQSQATVSFAINGGPYSPLQEYINMSKTDTLSTHYQYLFRQKACHNPTEFKQLLTTLKNEPHGQILTPAYNRYWLSYFNDPLYTDVGNHIAVPIHFIQSENYWLKSDESDAFFRNYLKIFPELHQSTMRGNGSFNEKAEQQLLLLEIVPYLNKR